jgi:hypothetical protein
MQHGGGLHEFLLKALSFEGAIYLINLAFPKERDCQKINLSSSDSDPGVMMRPK